MPSYKNNTSNTITTEIDGERYVVPPGEVCEIPRKLCYVIKSRGLPLDPAKESATVESTEVHHAPARLPPGVETGPVSRSDFDATEGGDEDDEDVAAVTADLQARGALPKSRSRKH